MQNCFVRRHLRYLPIVLLVWLHQHETCWSVAGISFPQRPISWKHPLKFTVSHFIATARRYDCRVIHRDINIFDWSYISEFWTEGNVTMCVFHICTLCTIILLNEFINPCIKRRLLLIRMSWPYCVLSTDSWHFTLSMLWFKYAKQSVGAFIIPCLF